MNGMQPCAVHVPLGKFARAAESFVRAVPRCYRARLRLTAILAPADRRIELHQFAVLGVAICVLGSGQFEHRRRRALIIANVCIAVALVGRARIPRRHIRRARCGCDRVRALCRARRERLRSI